MIFVTLRNRRGRTVWWRSICACAWLVYGGVPAPTRTGIFTAINRGWPLEHERGLYGIMIALLVHMAVAAVVGHVQIFLAELVRLSLAAMRTALFLNT